MMNAEQKQRALAALGMWHSSNDDSLREYQAADLMAGLLQEMVDAPEPEPFGYFKAEPFGWERAAEALCEADASIVALKSRLADVEAINSIDARFCGRLALILECAILDPHGHFELACQLLEEYKAAWEEVNPSPPTFMGDPMPPERKLAMNQLLETLK